MIRTDTDNPKMPPVDLESQIETFQDGDLS